MSTVEIAFPARLVTLTLTVGPEQGVTPLENFVARAVSLGCATVHELELLFGLNHNLVLDVVHSLWSKGHLMVDFDGSRVELSDGAREMLAARDGTLAGIADDIRQQDFLFEPITGRVLLPGRGRDGATLPQAQVPVDHPDDIRALPPAALLDAVSRLYRSEKDRSFRSRIVDVSFGSPVVRPAAEIRWVPLRVSVHRDPDSGRIVAVPTDADPEWDVTARRRLGEHIARTLEAEPKHPFSLFLAGKAADPLTPPATAQELLAELTGLVDSLPDLTAEDSQHRHKELTDLARRLEKRIREEDATRARATLLDGAEGRRWALRHLIRRARHQLVICSPLLAYAELNGFVEDLEPRLKAGVRLVLLWGHRQPDTLSSNVHTALEELRTRFPDQVVYSERSSAVQASFVVKDDTGAWLGPVGPLQREARETPEIGVLIEHADGGPLRPQAVQDLLYWSRQAFPSRDVGSRIAVYPEDFGAASPTARLSRPDDVVSPPGVGDQSDQRRLWAAAWAEYPAAVARSRSRAERVGPAVDVLSGGEWVDRAWTELRNARVRIVIGDHRQNVAAISTALRQALLNQANAGVDVCVVAPVGAGTDWREELDAEGLHTDRRQSAPILVVDDVLLLGPVPLLALGASDDLRASSVGLAVRGRELADKVCALVAGTPPGRTTGSVERPEPPATRSAAAAALPLLQEARRAAGGSARTPVERGEFARVLYERLPELDNPWLVFPAWQDAEVATDDLRSVAAALLTAGPWSGAPVETRRPVLRWLLVDGWSRYSFLESAVLAAAHTELCDRPSAAACLSAVPIELGPSCLDWIAVSSEVDADAESLLALVGCTADVLRWNALEAMPTLTTLADRDSPVGQEWRNLARAVLEHVSTSPVAFPLATVTALAGQGGSPREDAELWRTLAQEIAAIGERKRRFDFSSGRVLQHELFGDDGLMTVISRACVGGGKEREQMLARLPEETVRDHCDDVVKKKGFERIAWSKHQTFLNRLEDIVRQSRTLAARDSQRSDTEDLISPAARTLARTVAARRQGLWAEAEALTHPYDLPVRAMLALLEPVAQWGRTR